MFSVVKRQDKNFKPREVSTAVLNEDGTPKVVYHQTGADFTAFSTENPSAGAHDSETPNGIFFKDNDHDIGLDGQKQMACYIQMENPLNFENREAANRWYKKHIKGYSELSEKMDADVGAIDDKMETIEAQMFSENTTDEQYDSLDTQWNALHEEMAKVEYRYRDQLRELLNDSSFNCAKQFLFL